MAAPPRTGIEHLVRITSPQADPHGADLTTRHELAFRRRHGTTGHTEDGLHATLDTNQVVPLAADPATMKPARPFDLTIRPRRRRLR